MKEIISNENQPIVPYLAENWKYRSLLYSLVKKELKAKYAQTRFGLLWLFIQPLIPLVIFTLFFDRLIKVDTGMISYPVFVFSGMTVWYFFTGILNNIGSVLQNQQELIRKIYFPKLILFLSQLIVSFIEFLSTLLMLFVLILILKVPIGLEVLLIPIAIIPVAISGLCLALWLNILTVKRRDLQHLVPYLVNYGIWFTPVFYPVSIIPSDFHTYLYFINPIASSIDLFRSLLFGTEFNWLYTLSYIPIFFLLLIGIRTFKNIEGTLQDYL